MKCEGSKVDNCKNWSEKTNPPAVSNLQVKSNEKSKNDSEIIITQKQSRDKNVD